MTASALEFEGDPGPAVCRSEAAPAIGARDLLHKLEASRPRTRRRRTPALNSRADVGLRFAFLTPSPRSCGGLRRPPFVARLTAKASPAVSLILHAEEPPSVPRGDITHPLLLGRTPPCQHAVRHTDPEFTEQGEIVIKKNEQPEQARE